MDCAAGEALIREADDLLCQSWNKKICADGGPGRRIAVDRPGHQAGYPWLEINCSRCKTPRAVAPSRAAPRSDNQCARSRRSPALREVQYGGQAAGRGAAAAVAALPDRRCDVTELMRRRDRAAAGQKWNILYSDVVVGSIGLRTGAPNHADQWEWNAAFIRAATGRAEARPRPF